MLYYFKDYINTNILNDFSYLSKVMGTVIQSIPYYIKSKTLNTEQAYFNAFISREKPDVPTV